MGHLEARVGWNSAPALIAVDGLLLVVFDRRRCRSVLSYGQRVCKLAKKNLLPEIVTRVDAVLNAVPQKAMASAASAPAEAAGAAGASRKGVPPPAPPAKKQRKS
eukprot:15276491-Alexandrium_andersonii.AAC.2